VGIGFYIFFLVNRNYDGPFVDERVPDDTVYVTIAINVAEFFCLIFATTTYWIPLNPFQEEMRFLLSTTSNREASSNLEAKHPSVN